MIIAVDIGGTKTLVAAYNNEGFVKKNKFQSTKNYPDFIDELTSQIKQLANGSDVQTIVIGCPGLVDRQNGILKKIPNSAWINKPLVQDIRKLFGNIAIIIENDANLAALSEANELNNINQKVIYVTFSTGIGTGFVDNGDLVPELLDSEAGHMLFEHNGKTSDWESFAAGSAIVKQYGKMASELNNQTAWRTIANNMAIGLIDCCAIFPADSIIIGGGVGTYFYKYESFLVDAFKKLLQETAMIKMPIIMGAKFPEEAVIRGCIILAKQHEQC